MNNQIYLVAITVTAACGVLSARCALAFFKIRPLLFTAVALMALAWLMVLPYYGDLLQHGSSTQPSPSSTLLSTCGSYLLVVIGSLARRTSSASEVEVVDRYALLLLVPLATGSRPDLLKGLTSLTDAQFETLLATFVGTLGYVCLWYAARSLKPQLTIYRSFATIAFSYAGLELVFLVIQLLHQDRSAMTAVFVYLFAGAKLALTSIFLYILIAFVYPEMSMLKMFNVLVGADEAPPPPASRAAGAGSLGN